MTADKAPIKTWTIADVRRFFQMNETPIFFISATNFNVLGIDEWVRNFKYINYIDCFDGHHPNVFVPTEISHGTFNSIEDINNYLLEHKEVIDFIQRSDNKRGKATFLMFDARTEALCKDLDLEVCFPPARLRQMVDDKISGTRIGNRAGVESVPNVLAKVDSYETLRKVSSELGPDLVVQTAFGDSGHTTFFISTEAEYRKYAEEIAREPEVKVMKRIRCKGAALEACVTRSGTLVGPIQTELVGFKEMTPYRGGWCGNELYAGAFTPEIRKEAKEKAFAFGEELRRIGYRGYFELDFLVDLDANKVYLGEINPRITGASQMTNMAAFALTDAPLFLFHLLEFSGVDFHLDVAELNERWSHPDNIDSWGQLVIKHTDSALDLITEAPESGIYRMDANGVVSFARRAIHRRAVDDENEAFWLRISKTGDYRYEGADLGIFQTRGRLMTDDFQLTDRAKKWVSGIRALYHGRPLKPADTPTAPPPTKHGRFKIF